MAPPDATKTLLDLQRLTDIAEDDASEILGGPDTRSRDCRLPRLAGRVRRRTARSDIGGDNGSRFFSSVHPAAEYAVIVILVTKIRARRPLGGGRFHCGSGDSESNKPAQTKKPWLLLRARRLVFSPANNNKYKLDCTLV
jgi:hypothetical protein